MKIDRRLTVLSLMLVMVVVFLSGCATTKLVSSWSQPGFDGTKLTNVLVIGVMDDDMHRRMYEESFVAHLQADGIKAVASYTVVPDLSGDRDKDKVLIKAAVKKMAVDGVIVANLASIDKEERYVQAAPMYVSQYGGPHGMYGYYGHSYGIIHQPGYFVEDTNVVLRTAIFRVKDEAMIWTGETDSFNPDSAQEIIDDNILLIDEAVKEAGIL